MLFRNGLLITLLSLLALAGQGQGRLQPLPEVLVLRRSDAAYIDSLSQTIKARYRILSALPRTVSTDTLRLRALHHLGRLYRFWSGHRDSTLYFGNELVEQARQSQNLFYEINGKIILAEYYSTGERNLPLALRLNLELLAKLPPANTFYDVARYRINMNLGSLYGLARDYPNALRYLTQAQQLVKADLVYAGPVVSAVFRTEVEQALGGIYKQQDNFIDSEKHYLAAEARLTPNSLEAGRAYIYDDLAELYLKYSRFEQALPYAKKAEAIWNRLRPHDESKGWGTLACVYAGLNQNDMAYQYAQYVLQLPKPTKFVREQAYTALYQLYERKGDWHNSAIYYKKYIAMRDTITYDQRSLELAAIQKQAEFASIVQENQQARQLQTQRLLTVQKQAELNQLRANIQAAALTKKAQLSEQQRQFDNERAKALLNQQQANQEIRQGGFDQRVLIQKNQEQQNLIFHLSTSFVFVLSILALLLYLAQLQKRKAEAELRLTLERKEANARIIQTQETERQRIAADLHDDLGGTLATLHRRLADMRQQTTDADTQRAFADAEPLIQKSSDDLRRISHNLMPPEFERIGLRHALEQLVRDQPNQPTHFTFVTSGHERKLPLDSELNAYRIVSELVQNINKHAQANRAAVQLLYHADRLTITVEDDGLGNRIEPDRNKSVGIGLKNSSLRAEYIGATLWRDASEAGTLVVLDIPYPTPLYAARTSLPNSLN